MPIINEFGSDYESVTKIKFVPNEVTISNYIQRKKNLKERREYDKKYYERINEKVIKNAPININEKMGHDWWTKKIKNDKRKRKEKITSPGNESVVEYLSKSLPNIKWIAQIYYSKAIPYINAQKERNFAVVEEAKKNIELFTTLEEKKEIRETELEAINLKMQLKAKKMSSFFFDKKLKNIKDLVKYENILTSALKHMGWIHRELTREEYNKLDWDKLVEKTMAEYLPILEEYALEKGRNFNLELIKSVEKQIKIADKNCRASKQSFIDKYRTNFMEKIVQMCTFTVYSNRRKKEYISHKTDSSKPKIPIKALRKEEAIDIFFVKRKFADFVRKLRKKRIIENEVYCYALEKQKNGNWHVHFVCEKAKFHEGKCTSRVINNKVMPCYSCNYALGMLWEYGFCYVGESLQRGKMPVENYLAKYMAKDFNYYGIKNIKKYVFSANATNVCVVYVKTNITNQRHRHKDKERSVIDDDFVLKYPKMREEMCIQERKIIDIFVENYKKTRVLEISNETNEVFGFKSNFKFQIRTLKLYSKEKEAIDKVKLVVNSIKDTFFTQIKRNQTTKGQTS